MSLVIHYLHGFKKFIAWILAKILSFFCNSLRIVISDDSQSIMKDLHGKSKICAIWHENLLITPVMFNKFFSDVKMHGLISPSKDGAWGAYILNQLGISTIRGSSKRGGISAFLLMQRLLANEVCAITFTPDGPRGPKRIVKDGIVKLAKISKAPIVLATAKYSTYKTIKSWDQMKIPLPFSKIFINIYTILPEEIDQLSFEELKEKIQEYLNR